MGNNVCTNNPPLSFQDIRDLKYNTAKSTVPRGSKYHRFHSHVCVFRLSEGEDRIFGVKPVSCDAIQTMCTDTTNLVVAHVFSNSDCDLHPEQGGGSELSSWCEGALKVFTPRGLQTPMSTNDALPVKSQLKFNIYVLNGKRSSPLATGNALVRAFELERFLTDGAVLHELFTSTNVVPLRNISGGAKLIALPAEKSGNVHILRRLPRYEAPAASDANGQHDGRRDSAPTKVSPIGVPPMRMPEPSKPNKAMMVPLKLGALPRVSEHTDKPSESTGAGIDDEADPALAKARKLKQMEPEATRVDEGLHVGGEVAARDRDQLVGIGITTVINAAAIALKNDFTEDFNYTSLWLCDTPDQDIFALFSFTSEIIDEELKNGGKVFVHCHQGVSRSCSLILAYLMWKRGLSYDEAYAFVRQTRTICSPNPGFTAALLKWQKHLSQPAPAILYRFTPFQQDYAAPFIFHAEPVGKDVTLDPRACYGLVAQSDEGNYGALWYGAKVGADVQAACHDRFQSLLRYGFYTNKPNTSVAAERQIRFHPTTTHRIRVEVHKDGAKGATNAFKTAIAKYFASRPSVKVQEIAVLGGIYAPAIVDKALQGCQTPRTVSADVPSAKKRERQDVAADGGPIPSARGVPSLSLKNPLAKHEAPMTVENVEPSEEDFEEPLEQRRGGDPKLGVDASPRPAPEPLQIKCLTLPDGIEEEMFDLEDFMPNLAYCVIETRGEATTVWVWVGEEWEGDDDDTLRAIANDFAFGDAATPETADAVRFAYDRDEPKEFEDMFP